MFSKTNLISTLVTAIWAYLGGWVLWGMLGKSLLSGYTSSAAAAIGKDMPDQLHLILGCLILGFAFSTMYSKWARGTHNLSHGAEYGLWFGVLIGLGLGLIWYATANLYNSVVGTLLDFVINTIYYVVMGVLASMVYSKIKQEG